MSPELRRFYLEPYDSWAHRIAVQRFVDDIPLGPADQAYVLARQTAEGLVRFQDIPMLICWGEKDFVFDGGFLDEWRRRWPRWGDTASLENLAGLFEAAMNQPAVTGRVGSSVWKTSSNPRRVSAPCGSP